jgi:hypothetical protein
MKSLEKRVSNLEKFVEDIVGFQQKMVEHIHTQKEVNEFLSKCIKKVETRVIMMQSQQHVIDIVSNISRQQPMKEVFDE